MYYFIQISCLVVIAGAVSSGMDHGASQNNNDFIRKVLKKDFVYSQSYRSIEPYQQKNNSTLFKEKTAPEKRTTRKTRVENSEIDDEDLYLQSYGPIEPYHHKNDSTSFKEKTALEKGTTSKTRVENSEIDEEDLYLQSYRSIEPYHHKNDSTSFKEKTAPEKETTHKTRIENSEIDDEDLYLQSYRSIEPYHHKNDSTSFKDKTAPEKGTTRKTRVESSEIDEEDLYLQSYRSIAPKDTSSSIKQAKSYHKVKRARTTRNQNIKKAKSKEKDLYLQSYRSIEPHNYKDLKWSLFKKNKTNRSQRGSTRIHAFKNQESNEEALYLQSYRSIAPQEHEDDWNSQKNSSHHVKRERTTRKHVFKYKEPNDEAFNVQRYRSITPQEPKYVTNLFKQTNLTFNIKREATTDKYSVKNTESKDVLDLQSYRTVAPEPNEDVTTSFEQAIAPRNVKNRLNTTATAARLKHNKHTEKYKFTHFLEIDENNEEASVINKVKKHKRHRHNQTKKLNLHKPNFRHKDVINHVINENNNKKLEEIYKTEGIGLYIDQPKPNKTKHRESMFHVEPLYATYNIKYPAESIKSLASLMQSQSILPVYNQNNFKKNFSESTKKHKKTVNSKFFNNTVSQKAKRRQGTKDSNKEFDDNKKLRFRRWITNWLLKAKPENIEDAIKFYLNAPDKANIIDPARWFQRYLQSNIAASTVKNDLVQQQRPQQSRNKHEKKQEILEKIKVKSKKYEDAIESAFDLSPIITHRVNDDFKVKAFMKRILYNNLKLIRKFEERSKRTEWQMMLRSLAVSYKNKYNEFIDDTGNHNIKTRMGTERVVMDSIDVSHRILMRLVNLATDEMDKNGSPRSKVIPDLFVKKIKQLTNLEFESACSNFGICKRSTAFVSFFNDFLTVMLSLNDKKYEHAFHLMTAAIKSNDFTHTVGYAANKKLHATAHYHDKSDVVQKRGVVYVLKNVITKRNSPLVIYADNKDLNINKTMALIGIVKTLENSVPESKNNVKKWEYLINGIQEYAMAKKVNHTRVGPVMLGFVVHLKTVIEKTDPKSWTEIVHNANIISETYSFVLFLASLAT